MNNYAIETRRRSRSLLVVEGKHEKDVLFSDVEKIGLQIDKCTIFCYNNVQRKEELQCQ